MFAILAVTACVHRPPTVPDTPDGPRVTIMTYNVNFGLAGDLHGIDAIREGGADVVLLQETTAEWERVIRDELSDDYPHMLFRHCCRAGGLAFLSRYEIDDHDYVASIEGLFPAWRVVVHSPVGPLQVLNVHLRPPISDTGSVVSGYWSTPPVRHSEISQFHGLLDPDIPAVIAGDFNEGRTGRAVDFLRDRGYDDTRPSNGPHTWRWKTSVGTLRSALDHIVHDRALVVVDSRVIRRGRSDHLPVVATFAAAP
jgi:endonuclease/exonuclease/phosphatase (EEP) superfamily protein YafD